MCKTACCVEFGNYTYESDDCFVCKKICTDGFLDLAECMEQLNFFFKQCFGAWKIGNMLHRMSCKRSKCQESLDYR